MIDPRHVERFARRRTVAVAVWLSLITGAGVSSANGRFPASRSVAIDDDTVLLGVTFGLLLSGDRGATFHWVCEEAIGFGGTFDPVYAIGPEGELYATTFDGLRRSIDGGCTWTLMPLPVESTGAPDGGLGTNPWVSDIAIAVDSAVWVTTATAAQSNDVFVQRPGTTEFVSAGLPTTGWWTSIVIAPGDPKRVYVTGFEPGGGDSEETVKAVRSDDGGATWDELPVSDFVFGLEPRLFVDAVSPLNPDVVYVRVTGTQNPVGDTIYRSTDGGAHFTAVVNAHDSITGVVVRPDGSVAVATPSDGLRLSPSGAADSFEALADSPTLACLANGWKGELLGCGSNWPPDNFALGSSSTGAAWTPITTFQEIAPLRCASDSAQEETCIRQRWVSVCLQLGICGGEPDAGVEPLADAGTDPPDSSPSGCGCRAGAPGPLGVAALLAVTMIGVAGVLRRRARGTKQ